MRLLFWRKKKKTYDEKLQELASNELLLTRIENISVSGTKLVCIKNHGIINKSYTGIRDYIEGRHKKFYVFNKGETYEVKSVYNDTVNVSAGANSHHNNSFYGSDCTFNFVSDSGMNAYFFDIFMSEAEYIGTIRDNNINSILE